MTMGTIEIERITAESLLQNRIRLRLNEKQMAQLLGISTQHYLRWERGKSRPHWTASRTLFLFDIIENQMPGKFFAFLAALPKAKRGRPIGSVNLPDWIRPAPAPPRPKRKPGRPRDTKNNPFKTLFTRVGRPRNPESTRAIRRTCQHEPCGKIVYGGARFHPDCLKESQADLDALRADLTERRAYILKTLAPPAPVIPEPAAAPQMPLAPLEPQLCVYPGCGEPVTTGRVCDRCRAGDVPADRD